MSVQDELALDSCLDVTLWLGNLHRKLGRPCAKAQASAATHVDCRLPCLWPVAHACRIVGILYRWLPCVHLASRGVIIVCISCMCPICML